MTSLLFEFRLVTRGLWHRPGFAIASTLPLVFAIGASTTLFHLSNELVLRPRELLSSESLYVMWEASDRRGGLMNEISYPDFLDWREQTSSFEDMAAMGSVNWSYGWSDGGERLREIRYRSVSWSFFRVLGVEAAMGRTFVPEDDERDAARVVVASHAFWQLHLGGVPDVVGTTILLGPEGDEPYTLVGVMPPELGFPREAQLWAPLGRDLASFGSSGFDAVSARGLGVLFVVGRAREGVFEAAAASDMTRIVQRLSRDEHDRLHWRDWRVALTTVEELELGKTPAGLGVLGGAAAALLLISSLSVGGLLLARSMGGRRELAISSAIGAGPAVVLRKALLESVLVVLISAFAAATVAMVAIPLAWSRLPVASTAVGSVGDAGTGLTLFDIGLLTALSALAVVLVALPTVVSIRASHLFHDIASGVAHPSSLQGWHKPLVAIATATAMVLVTTAGLLARSYVELVRAELGFRPENVLSVQVSSPASSNEAAEREFLRDLVERIESVDGVVAAAAVRNRPLLHGAVGDDWRFIYEGQDESERDTNPTLNYVAVSSGYFRVMGTRLIEGRDFNERDRESSPGVVVVGESLARYAWPYETALGKRVWLGTRDDNQDPIWFTVVGVAADARYRGLTETRLDLYQTFEQTPAQPHGVVALTRDDPYAVVPAIREQVRAIDPTFDVERVTSMHDAVRTARAPWRFNMLLSSVLASYALGLAGLGLFGLIAYTAGQRTREMGIRAAIGATPSDIWRHLIKEGLAMVVVGIFVGSGAAVAASRILANLVYGIDVTDGATWISSALVLTATGLLACHWPARRAARMSPLVALRHD